MFFVFFFIDFYLKYKDTELLDIFTGPEGILSHVLFPAPLSQVPYIISHHFSFICHFYHSSTFFETLNAIHSRPSPPFVRTMNTANLSIFSVFSILPSLHRMPITLDCALLCLRPHWWINGVYMCICVVVVCESFAGLSWVIVGSTFHCCPTPNPSVRGFKVCQFLSGQGHVS